MFSELLCLVVTESSKCAYSHSKLKAGIIFSSLKLVMKAPIASVNHHKYLLYLRLESCSLFMQVTGKEGLGFINPNERTYLDAN